MSTVSLIAAGLVMIVGVNVWAAKADTIRNSEMKSYEDCIKVQYHSTPEIMYSNDGYLPDCK